MYFHIFYGQRQSAINNGCWKVLENKQEMKHSRFMKWNNSINQQEDYKGYMLSNDAITKLWLATTNTLNPKP
jgi:hypothetical protein